jgi:predicted O-methyltransferase YrrM
MFNFTTDELFRIERFFYDLFRIDFSIIRSLIFEFMDLPLHQEVYERRREVDPRLIVDWGVHKEIILPYILIRLTKPEVILETGTGIGVSDAYILEALNRNGIKSEFHSIGTQSLNLRRFPIGHAIPERLKDLDIVDYIQYPVLIERVLPEIIADLGDRLNIFFHDSAHDAENMYWELEQALPHADFLIVHDVHTNNGFMQFIQDYGLRGMIFSRLDPVRADLGIIF